MDYSTDLLRDIRTKASELMSPMEISYLLDIDEMQLADDIATPGHPARRAYYGGLAATANEMRRNVIDTASAGSPAAIAECQRRIMTLLSDVAL